MTYQLTLVQVHASPWVSRCDYVTICTLAPINIQNILYNSQIEQRVMCRIATEKTSRQTTIFQLYCGNYPR